MRYDEDQNTQNHSHATLGALNEAQKRAVLNARPPLWLNLCTAILVAIITLTMFYDKQSEMRKAVAIGVMGLYFLTWLIWCHLLRKRGIKVRTIPRSIAGKIFVVGQGIFYILVIIVAAAFLDQGVQSAPYVAALVNGISWAILTHHYPTGE